VKNNYPAFVDHTQDKKLHGYDRIIIMAARYVVGELVAFFKSSSIFAQENVGHTTILACFIRRR
jgi:hypothetical protein